MTSTQKPRISPVLPPDWEEKHLDALGAFPGGLKFVRSGWEENNSPVRGTHMLGTFAQHPELCKAFLTFNNHVATQSTLSARDKELLILRVGWLARCEYELIMHIIIGRRVGLTEEDIVRLQEGPDAPGWSEQDASLVRSVDELLRDGCIGDETWEKLSASYTHEQLMDIVFLVGCYETVAMAVASFGVSLEPGVEPLDDETRARMLQTEK